MVVPESLVQPVNISARRRLRPKSLPKELQYHCSLKQGCMNEQQQDGSCETLVNPQPIDSIHYILRVNIFYEAMLPQHFVKFVLTKKAFPEKDAF